MNAREICILPPTYLPTCTLLKVNAVAQTELSSCPCCSIDCQNVEEFCMIYWIECNIQYRFFGGKPMDSKSSIEIESQFIRLSGDSESAIDA